MTTTERRYYPYLRTSAQDRTLYEWWEQLQDKTGDRAQLRRCSSPGEVAFHPAYVQLVQQLRKENLYQAKKSDENFAIASVAGLLAHVRYNTGSVPPEGETANADQSLQAEKNTTTETVEIPDPPDPSLRRLTFGAVLGSGPSEKGMISDLRFRRLLQIDDRDTLYRTMIRIIRQLNYSVPVLSFAATILNWESEWDSERMRQQLAFDYYGALQDETVKN